MARNVSSGSRKYTEDVGSKFIRNYGCHNQEYYSLNFHLPENLTSLMLDISIHVPTCDKISTYHLHQE